MQVHVEVVREDELHVAEGIGGARPLADADVPVREVDAVGAHHAPVAHDLEVVLREIRRVAHEGGDRLLARDLRGHVPVGAEHHRLHLVAEDRRRAVRLARHHAHLQRRLPAVERREVEGGDVHEDVLVAERLRQPAPPLEVQLELADPRRHGDVQRGHRRRVQPSVRGQAVAGLEALQPRAHGVVEDRSGAGGRRGHVPRGGEPRDESGHPRPRLARLRGHGRPSAGGGDLAVAPEGLLQRHVLRVARDEPGQRFRDAALLHRRRQRLHEVRLAGLAEPVLVHLARLHAARLQVARERHEHEAEPRLRLRDLLRRRALLEEAGRAELHRLHGRDVVVRGVQAVFRSALDGGLERLYFRPGLAVVGPDGLVAPRLVRGLRLRPGLGIGARPFRRRPGEPRPDRCLQRGWRSARSGGLAVCRLPVAGAAREAGGRETEDQQGVPGSRAHLHEGPVLQWPCRFPGGTRHATEGGADVKAVR